MRRDRFSLPSSNRASPGVEPARGFSIVEVLVALVVLSVGLLGIASLYVVALRAGTSSINRMQAVNLAADMADRIRSNKTAGVAYQAAAAANCLTAACTPTQMAGNDLFIWQQEVTQALPVGVGIVGVDNTTSPFTYTVTVSWSEPGSGNVNYVLSFQI